MISSDDQWRLVLAQIGACESASRLQVWWWLHPWRRRKVTRVDWRGCMATERHVEKEGTLIGRAKRQLFGGGDKWYDGIIVRYLDGTEQWEPLARVRFAGKDHEVEVW